MLLNIDKPNKTAVLHIDKNCSSLPKPMGTVWKPRGRMGRDGGSFDVTSEAQARTVAARELSSAKFIICSKCSKLT